MSLQGKHTIVTGGSNGMGHAIARALSAAGAEVLITGRSEDTLAAATRELGPRVRALRSDASVLRDIELLAAHAKEVYGGLDAVFLNAGHCDFNMLADVSEAEYDKTFAINTKGVYFTLQRLAPLVREGGSFVLTTSIANAVGSPTMSTYAGAKAAVRSVAQTLAAELLPRNVRVNLLSPGFIKTPTMGVINANAEQRAEFEQLGIQSSPMGRMGTVDEVAKAALFLAFDATFTTGFEFLIDGGMRTLMTF